MFWALYGMQEWCGFYVEGHSKYRVEYDTFRDLHAFWFPLLSAVTSDYRAWGQGRSVDPSRTRAEHRLRKLNNAYLLVQERAVHEPSTIHQRIVETWKNGLETCEALISSYTHWSTNPVPFCTFALSDFKHFTDAFLSMNWSQAEYKPWAMACSAICKFHRVLTKGEPFLQFNDLGSSLEFFEHEICEFWVPMLLHMWPPESKCPFQTSVYQEMSMDETSRRLEKIMYLAERLQILRTRHVYEKDVVIYALVYDYWVKIHFALKNYSTWVLRH